MQKFGSIQNQAKNEAAKKPGVIVFMSFHMPKAEKFAKRGFRLLKKKEYSLAAAEFGKALLLDRSLDNAYVGRGIARSELPTPEGVGFLGN